MEIQYLREFLVLAEVENYGEAAEQLFVSQSSLFKHVKQIENELGVSLFDKKGKRIELGEFGKIFRDYAEEITRQDARCKKKIRSRLNVGDRNIRVWSSYHITDLAMRFHQVHGEYLINVVDGDNSMRQIKSVIDNDRYEIFFLTDISEVADELVCVPYTNERLCLIVNQAHPLADSGSVNLSELSDEPFILFHNYEKNGEHNPHNGIFIREGFTPRESIRVSRGVDAVRLVQRNFGVAVLSENIVRSKKHEGIAVIKLLPTFEYTVYCCYHKGHTLSHGAELLLDFIHSDMEKDGG